jgi:hypothetical protein
MKIKATNPYSEEENPISWIGWEHGLKADPHYTPLNWEKEVILSSQPGYSALYWRAFYRGQGAQIVHNYE